MYGGKSGDSLVVLMLRNVWEYLWKGGRLKFLSSYEEEEKDNKVVILLNIEIGLILEIDPL